MALAALTQLFDIVQEQFGVNLGTQPWWITGTDRYFIQRSVETQPFVKHIVIPNGFLVSPAFELRNLDNLNFFDENDIIPEVSDADFVANLRK